MSSILLVDADPFSELLAADLAALGAAVQHARGLPAAQAALARARFDLIVIEPGPSGEILAPLLEGLRDPAPSSSPAPSPRVVIVTGYGTVARAVQALRFGVADYRCKPVAARDLVRVPAAAAPSTGTPLPLEQAIGWQLRYALGAAGTVAEAARRLGVDRRSLRRMLARYPAP